MRLATGLVLATAIALAVFAWWGTSTIAGRARYDEMDGLYPMGAGVLAIILFAGASALGWVSAARARRSQDPSEE